MTEADFVDFARSAALRVTRNIGEIGHLVCTQANAKEPILREPEMRTAFQQEAEERGLFYGIEVPTKHTYQFTGVGKRRALIDFVLLDSASAQSASRDVLVEFKQGQPNGVRLELDASLDFPRITKDIHKLWAEPSCHGRCMFHICQASNSGTIKALMEKYEAVTQNAINLASATMSGNPGIVQGGTMPNRWFLLLILVLHQRGENTGSYLHRAIWQRDHWEFLKPELL